MKLYSENKNYKLYQGNMLDMLEVIQPNSIDSIITDPPYELNFMGKGWDNSGIAFQPDTWKKCYEVLKAGGYLLAFGGSRTFHRIACAIEDAGFEIRDTIMWLYGSGFPKSMAIDKSIEGKLTTGSGNTRDFHKLNGEVEEKGNYGYATMKFEQGDRPRDYNYDSESSKRLSKLEPTTELAKKYSGWGTALKPSFEPIIVARKPFKSSLVDNVIEYGVGGINIDECRVGNETTIAKRNGSSGINSVYGKDDRKFERENPPGRFPANTILTYDETNDERLRYFYCAKASRKDRDEGLDELESKQLYYDDRRGNSFDIFVKRDENGIALNQTRKNIHPTVKPTELMQYLIRLVSPKGSTILDCFNGSGSTGKAVMYENKERNKNYKYIGIELTEEYLPIAKARIEYVCDLKEEKNPQTTIFDFINEHGKD